MDSVATVRAVLSNLRSILMSEGYNNIDNGKELACFPQIVTHVGNISKKIFDVYGIKYNSSYELLSKSVSELVNDIIKKITKSEINPGHPKKKETRRLNLVVVGRAGVGKSSFLNYAAGRNVFKTGLGDPVTQSYFDVVNIEKPEKKVTYSLFDTKGLEAGNTEEWTNAIFSEIERRDKSEDIYEWFHTIIFCIDASAKRIQPFEVKAIKSLAENNSVLVLLTKKDLVTPDILDGLKTQLKQEIGDKVQVLSVCNVATRTRKGESKASGLEDVLRVSFLGLWEKASKMLPYRAIKQMVEINDTLILDKDLADLCALATLILWFTPENGEQTKDIVDAYDLASILDTDFYALIDIEKKIPVSYFRKIAELVDIKVYPSIDNVQIDIDGHPFPELLTIPNQLNHDQLDYWYYYSGMGTYMRLLKECFISFLDGIKQRIVNLREDVGKDGAVISEILKFYNDVNEAHQKPIFNHKTDEAISLLENTDYDALVKKIEGHVKKVRDALQEVGECVFTSGSERRRAERLYEEFQAQGMYIVRELENKFTNFLTTYEAELHSYGQYCIREDEFAQSNDGNAHHNSKDVAVLKKMIRAALSSDKRIGEKERMMLELYAEDHGISNSELDKLIKEERWK